MKNEALQNEVKKHLNGKECKLISDLKIRWNSILFMIKAFVKVEAPLLVVLKDLDASLNLEEKDFEFAKELVKVLDPIFIASKTICRRDATLLTAEIVFKNLIQELEKQNTEFSLKMAASFRKR